MGRRSFLTALWLTTAGALTGLLQACGSSITVSSTANCDGRAPVIGVTNGHTHTACVDQASLNVGGAYTLVLLPTGSGHSHTYDLSAADMSTLASGGSLPTGLSSVGGVPGHQHTVTF